MRSTAPAWPVCASTSCTRGRTPAVTACDRQDNPVLVRCDVSHSATVVTVSGVLDAARCRLLRDGLEAAWMMRRYGPITVDVSGARDMSGAALLILRRAMHEADRAGRAFTIRGLRASVLVDARAVRLMGTLWPPMPHEYASVDSAGTPR